MAMFPSQLLLSSKHLKEQILQPLFDPYGVELIVNLDFDTDVYGTFCGTTPRIEGPKITVKEKCLAGMAFANKRQGLASEGSFGPHPGSPFMSVNEEWLVYIDLDLGLEIYGRSTTIEVCHAQLHYQDAAQLPSFLSNCSFGKQGLVLKNASSGQLLEKGIQEPAQLELLLQQIPEWQIETDLRAHMNPLRQKNIAAAGKDLMERMQRRCPNCAHPDFSVQKVSGQLACSLCFQLTDNYQFLEYTCNYCAHHQIEERTDKKLEDPQFCNNCNP